MNSPIAWLLGRRWDAGPFNYQLFAHGSEAALAGLTMLARAVPLGVEVLRRNSIRRSSPRSRSPPVHAYWCGRDTGRGVVGVIRQDSARTPDRWLWASEPLLIATGSRSCDQ